MTMTVAQLREKLDEWGDHMLVFFRREVDGEDVFTEVTEDSLADTTTSEGDFVVVIDVPSE